MRAGRDHHQKRDEAVHEEAATPLDAPRVINRRRNRGKYSERGPGQREQATHSQPKGLAAKGVELPGYELELAGKVTEHETDDSLTIGGVSRHRSEN